MRKHLILVTFTIILTILLLSTSSFAASTSLSGDSAIVTEGNIVTYNVSVGAANVVLVKIDINVDSNLEVVSGSHNVQGASGGYNPDGNTIVFALSEEKSISGNIATFKVKGKIAKDTPSDVSVNVILVGANSEILSNESVSVALKVRCSEHKYGDYKVKKEAKCTSSGTKVRTCTVCGATDSATISSLGHDYGEWHVKTKATCKENGINERKCSRCNKTQRESIPAIGHTWGKWKVTSEPTCEDSGTKTRKCQGCGKVQKKDIEALGHSFDEEPIKDPTCTKDGFEGGICKRCGKNTSQVIPALGHDFSEWEVKSEVSCERDGVKVRKCKRCGEEEKTVVEKLGHIFTDPKVTKEATISSKGIVTGLCERCGEITQSIIPCEAKDDNKGMLLQCEEGTFGEGTAIVIDEFNKKSANYISVEDAFMSLENKEIKGFKLFGFSAIHNGRTINPNGEVRITYKLPKDYKNIEVYSISDDGNLTLLDSDIIDDGTKVIFNTKELGLYAVAKLPGGFFSNTILLISILLGLIAVISICIFIAKKKGVFSKHSSKH